MDIDLAIEQGDLVQVLKSISLIQLFVHIVALLLDLLKLVSVSDQPLESRVPKVERSHLQEPRPCEPSVSSQQYGHQPLSASENEVNNKLEIRIYAATSQIISNYFLSYSFCLFNFNHCLRRSNHLHSNHFLL